MISVLLPSRGRPKALLESIGSLLDNADEPDGIEILIAADADDQPTLLAAAQLPSQANMWASPVRYGYEGLHEYVNWLSGEVTGEWMMMWNDDARMLTEGWDTIIEQTQAFLPAPGGVLWPLANHDAGGNLFPIWPYAWRHAMGYVSRAPNIDVWISEIGRKLGLERQIPVRVYHNRADVTGAAEDDTFKEGRAEMGRFNSRDYDSRANRAERTRVVRLLMRSFYAES